jgi:hypothetical protein
MKHVYFTTKTVVLALTIATLTLIVVGYQNVQTAFKKAATEGRSIRISEVNSCPTQATTATAQFSGCNSII